MKQLIDQARSVVCHRSYRTITVRALIHGHGGQDSHSTVQRPPGELPCRPSPTRSDRSSRLRAASSTLRAGAARRGRLPAVLQCRTGRRRRFPVAAVPCLGFVENQEEILWIPKPGRRTIVTYFSSKEPRRVGEGAGSLWFVGTKQVCRRDEHSKTLSHHLLCSDS